MPFQIPAVKEDHAPSKEQARVFHQLRGCTAKDVLLARMATTGALLPIRVQHMLVSVSSKIYPAVSALLPVDEAARAVYASLKPDE
jgi:hypothetical protein